MSGRKVMVQPIVSLQRLGQESERTDKQNILFNYLQKVGVSVAVPKGY